jgi:hypothetical protein
MSLELNDLPRAVFRATHISNLARSWYRGGEIAGAIKYMEVPITGDEFEIPVVAFMTFMEMVQNNKDLDHEAIVLSLYSREDGLRYTTVDRYMRDVLVDDFKRNHLLKCTAKGKDCVKTYYATHGAVFTEDFTPVFMCSWMMKKCYRTLEDGNLEIHYKFLYPIIRIDPGIYLSQQDTMEKFLIKKFTTLALTDQVYTPFPRQLPDRFKVSGTSDFFDLYIPSLRVEVSPFHIREACKPDINTTNEKLRQTVLEHVEEVMQ